MRWLIVVLLIGACGGDGEETAPPPQRWHVSAGQLRAPGGRTAILRGANLSGVHKHPPYFDYHELPDYELLSDEYGMNAIRFLVEWAAIEPAEGQYDEAYLDEVARRMAWADQAGLVVILDMHQDVYGEGFGHNGAPAWTCDQSRYDAYEPTSPWFANYADDNVVACFDQFYASAELRGHYAEAWRRLAVRLADEPAVIGFDPMNEPYWGSTPITEFETGPLTQLYVEVAEAVRSAAPDWVAFLEPTAGRNLGVTTKLQPMPFGDVVYSPHSYEPSAENGDGFDPARREAVLGNYEAFRVEADGMNAALWIGEYGGTASDPGIVPYMDAQYDGAGSVAASTMYWNYTKNDGYGMLDAEGNEKDELISTLVRPYPERIAGDLSSYEYDEDTRRLEVSMTPSQVAEGPTLLRAPGRVYPAGVNVECGGCEVVVEGDRVSLMGLPGGEPIDIVMTPVDG